MKFLEYSCCFSSYRCPGGGHNSKRGLHKLRSRVCKSDHAEFVRFQGIGGSVLRENPASGERFSANSGAKNTVFHGVAGLNLPKDIFSAVMPFNFMKTNKKFSPVLESRLPNRNSSFAVSPCVRL